MCKLITILCMGGAGKSISCLFLDGDNWLSPLHIPHVYPDIIQGLGALLFINTCFSDGSRVQASHLVHSDHNVHARRVCSGRPGGARRVLVRNRCRPCRGGGCIDRAAGSCQEGEHGHLPGSHVLGHSCSSKRPSSGPAGLIQRAAASRQFRCTVLYHGRKRAECRQERYQQNAER